jgi:carboxymethylenebutenolidase
MDASDITIDTIDGPMPAHLARPTSEPPGSIIVVQEAFGVTEHIEDVCHRLAEAGWLAVAPALFHRQGAPTFAYDDFEQVAPTMRALTKMGITEDIAATLATLESDGYGPDRCGIVGFCMGGTVAFVTATQHALGAAVTYYGGGVAEGRFGFPALVELAPALRTPWLGLYGDLDKAIPPTDVEALRAAVKGAKVETEIIRYADADHGFNCNDRPTVYNPGAAANAWSHMLAWFGTHIATRAASRRYEQD